MQFPRIHLNGTSPVRLLEQYTHAANAVNNAIQALCAIEVHGRDYYTISDKAVTDSYAEHRERVASLHKIHTELQAVQFSISEQMESHP